MWQSIATQTLPTDLCTCAQHAAPTEKGCHGPRTSRPCGPTGVDTHFSDSLQKLLQARQYKLGGAIRAPAGRATTPTILFRVFDLSNVASIFQDKALPIWPRRHELAHRLHDKQLRGNLAKNSEPMMQILSIGLADPDTPQTAMMSKCATTQPHTRTLLGQLSSNLENEAFVTPWPTEQMRKSFVTRGRAIVMSVTRQ